MRDLVLKGTVTTVYEKDASGKTQTFLIQTDEQYSKPVAVKVWLDKNAAPASGSYVTANARVESREYNGKAYTDIVAWKIEATAAVAQDLPF